MIDKTREMALKILYKIDQEKAYSNIALDEELKQNKLHLQGKDVGLISEIVYGVTTWKLTIDEVIKKYAKIRLKKISPWILSILRMGIYQIVFLDKIPKSAAVNESVNLAKRYGHSASSNFVNAILRKVEKKDYEELFQIKDPIEKISKTMSMPLWLVQELAQDRPIQKVEEICQYLNERPKLCVRVNKLKTKKEELKKLLAERKISYEEIQDENFFYLKKLKNIEKLDLFEQGYFTVQDRSAGLTALILDPKPGEYVLDACSAPGGKTTYLAELMEDKGRIDAWDIHEHRTKLIEQNAKRLGIHIIKTNVKDSTILEEENKEKYDKILLDVPCMGIGVIKRKPDIKWQKRFEDLEEIIKIQEGILQNCSSYLKKEGILVYSTCSILREENEFVIQKFLAQNSDFELVEIDEKWKKEFNEDRKKTGILKIEPDAEKDGFFMAKLRRIR